MTLSDLEWLSKTFNDTKHCAASLQNHNPCEGSFNPCEGCLTLRVRVRSRFGDRCFAAAGPRIWNNLPASLPDKEVSCTEFRKQLKTFMFQTYCGASWLFWLLRLTNTLTYLLTYLRAILISIPNRARDNRDSLLTGKSIGKIPHRNCAGSQHHIRK